MKKFKKPILKFLPILLLILLCLPAIKPLFNPGFFTMHDDQQVARLYELDLALQAGQFPARWVSNLGFGYGYPLYVFYPPLVYYLGEIFHLLFGLSFLLSTKLVFAIAFLGAAFFMYLWAKERFGKIPALAAAAFYTYAPYHAVDAYVRGALAELFSFVWLPLIFWSADQAILGKSRKHFLWLGVFLALLMVTHNLIFLPFFPLLLIYLSALILSSKNRRENLISSFFSLALAFGLSAFFWLPALAEKKYTLVDNILLQELYQYKLHFVAPSQLWNSLWGYGGSTQGLLDGMSFKVGKAHLLFSLVAFCLFLWQRKFSLGKPNPKPVIPLVFILLVFCAFLATAYSGLIWDLAKPLQYLQFPWRFLTFMALFSSFLTAAFVRQIADFSPVGKQAVVVTAMLATLLLYPNLKLFRPQTYLAVRDSDYLNDEFVKWKISKTSFEFVPKEVAIKTEWNPVENREITQVDITREEIAIEPFKIVQGEGEIKVEKQASGLLVLSVKNREELVLQLNTFAFPGWNLTLNGKPIEYHSQNKLKLLTVNLKPSPESQQLKAVFGETPLRKVANSLSLISLIFLFLFFTKIIKGRTY